MKNFWGSFLGSVIGTIVTGIVCTLLLIVGIAGIFSGAMGGESKQPLEVKENSILKISLTQDIPDKKSSNPFAGFNFEDEKSVTLREFHYAIQHAAKDEKIKGIYLDLSGIATGLASLEEVKRDLEAFKKSGKFIVSYSDVVSQKAFYLATVADEIYLNPLGDLDFRGLGMELMFYKNTLDKLGVETHVVRPTGNRFKSAVEPFILDKASESNRLQLAELLQSMWQHMLESISKKTGHSIADLQTMANTMAIYDAEQALSNKFVTALVYQDEFENILRKKVGLSENAELTYVSLHKYASHASSKEKETGKDKIAVVYATGDIIMGNETGESIGGNGFVKTLREIRLDSSIKAVVLRVNSPGGDALASDMIWREVDLLTKVKPVVVSMGNYAASGGYYISAAADTIVAEPTTLTGSIGVFGMIFNAQKLLNEKLGVTIDTVKTNRFADFPTGSRPLTNDEKLILQRNVDKIYTTFLKRVSDGRGIPVANVDSIAQGRVWTGIEAKKLGLVDVLGGLQTAIDIAAKMAKVESYSLNNYPEEEDPFKKILEDLSASSAQLILENNLQGSYKYFQHLQSLGNMTGIQTRLPFTIDIY